MISTGTARQNSTIAPLIQRIARFCERRPTPKTNPKAIANATAATAALMVFQMPRSR
jgi:hypothetical protein